LFRNFASYSLRAFETLKCEQCGKTFEWAAPIGTTLRPAST
jgi:hypothetical protein